MHFPEGSPLWLTGREVGDGGGRPTTVIDVPFPATLLALCLILIAFSLGDEDDYTRQVLNFCCGRGQPADKEEYDDQDDRYEDDEEHEAADGGDGTSQQPLDSTAQRKEAMRAAMEARKAAAVIEEGAEAPPARGEESQALLMPDATRSDASGGAPDASDGATQQTSAAAASPIPPQQSTQAAAAVGTPPGSKRSLWNPFAALAFLTPAASETQQQQPAAEEGKTSTTSAASALAAAAAKAAAFSSSSQAPTPAPPKSSCASAFSRRPSLPKVRTPFSRVAAPSATSSGVAGRISHRALPTNQVADDIEAATQTKPVSPENFTPGGSTPFRLGYVRCVTDVWVDTHTRPATEEELRLPDLISETRASARYDNPTFPERRSAVEEGLKHLPNAWSA